MMSGNRNPVTEADLHAWLDGELPEERLAEVERHLADHPEDALRLERYRAQRSLMMQSFGPLLDQPLPDRLTPPFAAREPDDKPPRRWGMIREATWGAAWGRGWSRAAVGGLAVAASLLVFVAGGASGWLLRDRVGWHADPLTAAFIADAVAAHRVFSVEVRHPVEIGVDQEAHLVNWLSKRLGKSMRCPTVTRGGYQLIGGRLLADSAGPVALYMYEDAAGRRITLYIRPSPNTSGSAFRFAQDDGLRALYWQDNGLAIAVTGEADRDTLSGVAEEVYGKMNS
ncbi:anti-sigma factor family protein [Azospirillum picis]|uniref:Anti-sigma factor RsiW n=1 Tax=Azospirillum picis TaxID=488438 RepID=A0ABU0MGG3_9PROT|nr:anti-sigma factor [Azospirillum picis]MBP2298632.1 anti-sigma factor RsiW [Azospirillum picis]MDQ0532319.1 anti-sigma factor RsiW [Azospirillum picis]